MFYGDVDYRTIDRSGSGERPRPVLRQVWATAGMLWAAANLAALSLGLFPSLVSAPAPVGPVLPALRAVVTGQAAFALVIYPLVLICRGTRTLRLDAVELGLWALVAAPFVIPAAYLSNATAMDVGRAGLLIAAFFAAGWLLGRMGLARPSIAHLVVLVGLTAVLAGPMMVYITWEFGPGPAAPAWLRDACPVTLAWAVAAPRQSAWLPTPTWAWLGWPLAAVPAAALAAWWPRGRKEGATGG